jgi:hypothetical protein
MLKSIAVLAVLAVSSLTFAQIPGRAARADANDQAVEVAAQKALVGDAIDATSVCANTFTAPGSATKFFLKYCTTVNGNIAQFESPSGVEHIRSGAFGEGYGICDATGGGRYFDYADFGDSGNWLAPVQLSLNTTTVKIARTTSDGIWTLTQTIQMNANEAYAKVTMALKNNTAINRSVNLYRWADVDASGALSNIMDGTADSAWGYNVSLGHGLKLRRQVNNPFSHNGWARNTASGPADPCNLDPNYVGSLSGVDGSIVLYHGITVPKLASKSVVLSYQAF